MKKESDLPSTKILAVVVCTALWSCPNPSEEQGTNEDRQVEFRVRRDSLKLEKRWKGRITSAQTMEIRAEQDLRVSTFEVLNFSSIKAGQVIARSDTREVQKKKEGLETNLEKAKLDLSDARVKIRLTEKSYKRKKQLLRRGVIARKDVEQAHADLLTDRNKLEKLRISMSKIQQDLEEIEMTLGNSQLLAPMDGIVRLEPIPHGQKFSPGDLVARVSNPQSLAVELLVDEIDLATLKLEQEVSLSVKQVPGARQQGRIQKIGRRPSRHSNDVGARKFPVTVALNDTKDLKEGFHAEALLSVAESSSALIVPLSAVVYLEGEPYLMVRDVTGQLTPRAIQLGLKTRREVEVVKGVAEGDPFVIVL